MKIRWTKQLRGVPWLAKTTHLTLGLLVCSVAVNVVQSREMRSLKQRDMPGVPAGTSLASVTGRSLDGQPVSLRLDSGVTTVLYYFSPACGWCERNWANFRHIQRSKAGQLRFVGIATGTVPPAYLNSRSVDLEVIQQLSGESIRALRLGGTPQTVVVSGSGKVVAYWTGAYIGGVASQVEEHFGVSLPGVSAR